MSKCKRNFLAFRSNEIRISSQLKNFESVEVCDAIALVCYDWNLENAAESNILVCAKCGSKFEMTVAPPNFVLLKINCEFSHHIYF